MSDVKTPELVTVLIDGKEVTVPKGTNLIEAAKSVSIDIPHYCYHQNLSIAGNCRMCQVAVKGQPKLTVACNTGCTQGMEVSTHHTSKDVADAQAATLEFILINHPLDCTVCDQAGHCKLQDYHYEYNARESRFLEDKVEKVKAEPLGPTVMLDGERCIMCTRCVRFCDEVTGTSEMGLLNRGDQTVIAVSPGRELDNPLSGSVVDLCPVGALTHKKWRFNTRIWFTKQTDSICPGCSTGCNVKVAERDGMVVQVKARNNQSVNKEWLCDEGRYGFERFLPKSRVTEPMSQAQPLSVHDILRDLSAQLSRATIFVAPDLLLEEYMLLKILIDKNPGAQVHVAYKERNLTDIEKILVSPDYAPNFRGAEVSGLVSGDLEAQYKSGLEKVKSGQCETLVFLGDRSVSAGDVDLHFLEGVTKAVKSYGFFSDLRFSLVEACKHVLPVRCILEKSGIFVNRNLRAQYIDKVVPIFESAQPEFRYLLRLCEELSVSPFAKDITSDRDLTHWAMNAHPRLSGTTIRQLKFPGVDLTTEKTVVNPESQQVGV